MKDMEARLSRLRRHLTAGALQGQGRLGLLCRVPRCQCRAVGLQSLVLRTGLVSSTVRTVSPSKPASPSSPALLPPNAPSPKTVFAGSLRFGTGGWDPFAIKFTRMRES